MGLRRGEADVVPKGRDPIRRVIAGDGPQVAVTAEMGLQLLLGLPQLLDAGRLQLALLPLEVFVEERSQMIAPTSLNETHDTMP